LWPPRTRPCITVR
nr:immunoglobulin heavy chain junction region [Homo sapiens]